VFSISSSSSAAIEGPSVSSRSVPPVFLRNENRALWDPIATTRRRAVKGPIQPHGLLDILAWILRDPVLLRGDSCNGRPRPGVYGINDLLEPVVRWQRFEAATNHEVGSSNLSGRASRRSRV
ncbi:MAG: hypothetical protein ACK55I_05655, partial [bacterium]